MRTYTQGLLDLLNSGNVVRCHLYTFRMHTGQVYRYTNADVAIVAGGQLYAHDGPSVSGAQMRQSRGLEPDEQKLSIAVLPEHTIGGVSWLTAVRSGALDDIEVVIQTAFMADWGATPQTIEWFRGTVQQAGGDDLRISLTVESDSARFGQMLPRDLYGPGCVFDVFERGCDLIKANYQADGFVTGGNRARLTTALAQPDNWFSRGYVVFTGGPNAGVRRSIRTYVALQGAMEFSTPLVFDPQPGDTFVAYPGCNKTRDDCRNKFGNVVNGVLRFKGFPVVPSPETVV